MNKNRRLIWGFWVEEVVVKVELGVRDLVLFLSRSREFPSFWGWGMGGNFHTQAQVQKANPKTSRNNDDDDDDAMFKLMVAREIWRGAANAHQLQG